MTEDDRINTANLTRLKIASHVLRGVLPIGPIDSEGFRSVLAVTRKWENELNDLLNANAPTPE